MLTTLSISLNTFSERVTSVCTPQSKHWLMELPSGCGNKPRHLGQQNPYHPYSLCSVALSVLSVFIN